MTIMPSHFTLYHEDFLAVQSWTTELIRGQEEKKNWIVKKKQKKKLVLWDLTNWGVVKNRQSLAFFQVV